MNDNVSQEQAWKEGGNSCQVSFVSDAFPRCAEDEEQVNPERWGYKAAEFIRDGLMLRGLQAHGPVGEDWGWALSVMHGKDMFIVGCGIVDDEENRFLVFVDSLRPFWKFFSKRPDVTPVAQALDELLRDSPMVGEVVWE